MNRQLKTRLMRPPRRPGSALYVTVVGTTLIVSVLGMSALAVVRIERRDATTFTNRLLARSHARSAVEWGLKQITNNSSWRTAYANNAETATQSLAAGAAGTVSWKLQDADGSLTNADAHLRLKGYGRVGQVLQVNSLQLQTGVEGPLELRRHSGTSTATEILKYDKWWGQYFKVSLPADANGWRVTSIQLYCERNRSGRQFTAKLLRPLPTKLPSATVVDSATLNSSWFDDEMDWQTISFSGNYWLNVGDDLCLALEATADEPLRLRYSGGGVSEANSALLSGGGTWTTATVDKALLYRIRGEYTTVNGVRPIAGTWNWDGP